MDPNETLRLILEARKSAEAAREGDSNDAEIEALWELAEHTDNLMTWLSNGGYQPDWQLVAAEVFTR